MLDGSSERLVVLDCTLRDGGYYTSWDFDDQLVREYLSVMARSGVQYVELGLRQFPGSNFKGAFAYTTRQFLESIDLPEGIKYAVMIDAKTVLDYDEGPRAALDRLFCARAKEKFDMVRVAAHFDEVTRCKKIIHHLRELGYEVGINIMQISRFDSDAISSVAAEIQQWGAVNVLYFADSLGSMQRTEVTQVVHDLRKGWHGDIGFHSHNNMGYALDNVLCASDLGVSFLDCTVTGMGRGAGNAETEKVLLALSDRCSDFNFRPVHELAEMHFGRMKTKHKWGESLLYYISATLGVHPTYVQSLVADSTLSDRDVPEILEIISKKPRPSRFEDALLQESKSLLGSQIKGSPGQNVTNLERGRDVILVAQTEDSTRYKKAIMDYRDVKDAVVASINMPINEMEEGIKYDYVFISHNQRALSDREHYLEKTEYKFVAPHALFDSGRAPKGIDYGLDVRPGAFQHLGDIAIIPSHLTVAYAIAFFLDAGVSNIFLVGFKGFSSEDPRQRQMEALLSVLFSEGVDLISLTPTSYSIKEQSIYAI